jgi:hypothetical protein
MSLRVELGNRKTPATPKISSQLQIRKAFCVSKKTQNPQRIGKDVQHHPDSKGSNHGMI